MAKILAPSSRKWRKKNQFGENGGERKINPSANPDCLPHSSNYHDYDKKKKLHKRKHIIYRNLFMHQSFAIMASESHFLLLRICFSANLTKLRNSQEVKTQHLPEQNNKSMFWLNKHLYCYFVCHSNGICINHTARKPLL